MLPRPDLGRQPAQSLNPSDTGSQPRDSRDHQSQSTTFSELCSPPADPSMHSSPGAVVPTSTVMLGIQNPTM